MKNWTEVREEYLGSNVSYGELAEKYGISKSSIGRKALSENWREQKERQNEGPDIMEERLERLGDAALKKIERAMCELEMDFQKGELLSTGIVDTGRLRQIIQSIKDLRDIAAAGRNKKGEVSRLYDALEKEDDA